MLSNSIHYPSSRTTKNLCLSLHRMSSSIIILLWDNGHVSLVWNSGTGSKQSDRGIHKKNSHRPRPGVSVLSIVRVATDSPKPWRADPQYQRRLLVEFNRGDDVKGSAHMVQGGNHDDPVWSWALGRGTGSQSLIGDPSLNLRNLELPGFLTESNQFNVLR